jgi:hypothetical protein
MSPKLESPDIRPPETVRPPRVIYALAPIFLFIAAFAFSWHTAGLVRHPVHDDAWFDADTGWVYWNVTDIHGVLRTRKHPLFSVFIFPLVKALSISGIDKGTAARLVFSGIAGVWVLLLFGVLRRRLPRLDAFIFGCVGLLSAAFLFWSWATETFLLSSVTILFATFIFDRKSRHPLLLHFAAGFATLSVTITNWTAALLSSALSLPLSKAVRVSLLALVAVAGLATLQSRILRTQGLFFDIREQASRETAYVNHTAAGGLPHRWRMFWIGGVLLPGVEPRMVQINGDERPMLSAQTAPGNLLWMTGATVWLFVLGAGLFTALRRRSAFDIYLLTLTGFHLLLHTVYGYETFLYTMHFTPLLILIAANAASVYRNAVLTGGALLAACEVLNNLPVLERALAILPTIVRT